MIALIFYIHLLKSLFDYIHDFTSFEDFCLIMVNKEIFLMIDKSSPDPNNVGDLVPYPVNDKFMFFGPGNAPFRKEMRDRFMTHSDNVVPEVDIYFVGVNKLSPKFTERKIIWVGKLSRVMSFDRII